MALYCIVTDVRQMGVGFLSIFYELRDDASDPPDAVLDSGGYRFEISTGESLTQNRARLKAEVDRFFSRQIALGEAVSQHIEQLRTDAIGYRLPAAAP